MNPPNETAGTNYRRMTVIATVMIVVGFGFELFGRLFEARFDHGEMSPFILTLIVRTSSLLCVLFVLLTAIYLTSVLEIGAITKRVILAAAIISFFNMVLNFFEAFPSLDNTPILGGHGAYHRILEDLAVVFGFGLFALGFFVFAIGAQADKAMLAREHDRRLEEVKQRRAAEKDLLEKDRRLEEQFDELSQIYQSAPVGISYVDSDLRYVRINERLAAINGHPVQSHIGRTFADVIPEIADQVEALYRRILETGEPLRDIEIRGTTPADPDTQRIWVTSYDPTKNARGEVTGVIAVVLDVTEHKTAEAEIRRLNTELEARVAVRTAELKAANKELEAFTYSVSHDLRGPLRTMRGFGRALLEDHGEQLDDEGRDYLRRINRAGEKMGTLIDDLLDFSRVAQARLELQEIDLSAMASEIAESLARNDPEREVEFAIEPGVAARGDAALVRIALENLLGNAWKFTGKNEKARIEFGLYRDIEERENFFVRDNGIGFDAPDAEKLFTVFQRLDSARDFEGSGVGLATVERIVRRHGGRVWAEGKPDVGATFFFRLNQAASRPPASAVGRSTLG